MPRLDFCSSSAASAAEDVLQENGFYCCDGCSEYEHGDDMRSVDEGNYCESCAEEANYCEHCCESSFGDVYDVDGTSYCESCRENQCYEHSDGTWHEEEEEETTEEEAFESAAIESAPEMPTVLLAPYPMAGYHGDTSIRNRWRLPASFCVGVEIETATSHRDAMSNELRNAYLVACERDGSLPPDTGIELVLPALTTETLFSTLSGVSAIMTRYRCNSWDNSQYEFGVHVNLDARNMVENTKRRLCNCFGPTNKQWMQKFAGRKTNYARFNDSDSSGIQFSKMSACGEKSGGRMEIRIFKSSRKIDTLQGYVSLCLDMLKFAEGETPVTGLFQWLKDNGGESTLAQMRKRKLID